MSKPKSMKLIRVDSERDINRDCTRIEIQIGDSVITIQEQHGQLVVHGDDTDLMISCGSRNSFTIITKPT